MTPHPSSKSLLILALFSLALLLFSCSPPTAKNGDTVKINYLGTLDDGTVFDSSEKSGKLFEFTLGKKQVIPGFEKAVEGMKVGEKKNIVIPPEEAYGEYKEDLRKSFPVTAFSEKVQPGDVVNLVYENGREAVARALLVTEDAILVDFNHPLAGKTLHFEIALEEIVGS